VLLTPASYSGCSDSSFDWIEQSLCFGLNSSPIAGPALAWVVASEPTGFPGGIASIQFGVEHDASVGSWTSCTGGLEIAEPGWPASGTGNALTWDDCVSDTGGNVRVGYFFLSAGDVGTIQVVGDPRQGSQAAYTNCNVEAVGICRANLGTLDLADPDPPVCADVPGPPPNAATDCVAIGDVCRVTVDWLHDGTDVVGFDVLRDGVVIDDVGPSERTYVDTLAPPGVTSLYEVVARNHCADATPSNTASAVLITDAVPATHVSASYGECEAVHVTWDHPGGANGFKILRDGVDVHQVTGGQRQYYDFDGPADTEVHYTIVAFGCADAPPSAPALGHRLGNPPAPSWVDASHECPNPIVTIEWMDELTSETGFVVYRSRHLQPLEEIGQTGPDVESFVDTAPIPGVLADYAVRAMNVCGVSSMSARASTRFAAPLAPSALSITDRCVPYVDIAWLDHAVTEDEYVIVRDGVEVASLPPDTQVYRDDDLPLAQTYTYQVLARSECGDGASPLEPGGTAGTMPLSTPCQVFDECPVVRVDWQSSETATHFRIYRDGDELAVVEATVSEFIDSEVVPATEYTYVVEPFNACLTGEPSNDARITVCNPIDVDDVSMPTALALTARPNPFNPRTTLTMELPEAAVISVDVFDAAGRMVRALVEREAAPAGHRSITWDGRDAAGDLVGSGVYIARLRTGGESRYQRLVLLK
jgi:hypothetical protein